MSADYPIDRANLCPACGAQNECAVARGETRCWCMAQPIAERARGSNTSSISSSTSCYCRICLRELSLSNNSYKADA